MAVLTGQERERGKWHPTRITHHWEFLHQPFLLIPRDALWMNNSDQMMGSAPH